MAMLKGLIIFMGVLIVVGVGVIAVTIFNRMNKPKVEVTETAPAAAPPVPGAPLAAQPRAFGGAVLNVGAGCEIAETRADAGRLIVRTDGSGACRRIHIIDLATGASLGTLDVLPAR
ncbi:MAG: hypothetical protein ACYC1L_16360 [Alphaproteobacteria bacterium]